MVCSICHKGPIYYTKATFQKVLSIISKVVQSVKDIFHKLANFHGLILLGGFSLVCCGFTIKIATIFCVSAFIAYFLFYEEEKEELKDIKKGLQLLQKKGYIQKEVKGAILRALDRSYKQNQNKQAFFSSLDEFTKEGLITKPLCHQMKNIYESLFPDVFLPKEKKFLFPICEEKKQAFYAQIRRIKQQSCFAKEVEEKIREKFIGANGNKVLFEKAIDLMCIDELLENEAAREIKTSFNALMHNLSSPQRGKIILHDPIAWLKSYDIKSAKEIEIFAQTKKSCLAGFYLPTGTPAQLNPFLQKNMQTTIEALSFSDDRDTTEQSFSNTDIHVFKENFFNVALWMESEGVKPAVFHTLSFCEKQTFDYAQSDLFLRSNAFLGLDPHYNPTLMEKIRESKDVIYVKDIQFYRGGIGCGYSFCVPRNLDLFFKPEIKNADQDSIRKILRIALFKGYKAAILDASMFANKNIAEDIYNVLIEEEFKGKFKRIAFVIDSKKEDVFLPLYTKLNGIMI